MLEYEFLKPLFIFLGIMMMAKNIEQILTLGMWCISCVHKSNPRWRKSLGNQIILMLLVTKSQQLIINFEFQCMDILCKIEVNYWYSFFRRCKTRQNCQQFHCNIHWCFNHWWWCPKGGCCFEVIIISCRQCFCFLGQIFFCVLTIIILVLFILSF